jgi:hypothetical protein
MAFSSAVDRLFASGLVQPDATTCGSCVLVVARLLHQPAYADFLVAGTIRDRFAQEALAMHLVTSGLQDSDGRFQVPWPRALGTSPWALARELSIRSGARYRARPILPGRRSQMFERIVSLARAGHALPLYVGNRWSPRHIVLVLPRAQPPYDVALVYDPATGSRYPIDGGEFSHGSLDVAGWHLPWAAVLPTVP